MMFRKLSKEQLEVGELYVVYDPNSANLAANGNKGVIVRIESKTPRTLKVKRFDGSISNLKLGADGAFAYRLEDARIEVVVNVPDITAFPAFSKRMIKEGWNGKTFMLSLDEIYVDEMDDSPHKGTTFLRHVGETIDPDTDEPFVNTFLMQNIYPNIVPEWIIPRAERMGIGAVELPLPPKPVAQEHEAVLNKCKKLLSNMTKRNTVNVSFAKLDKDGDVIRKFESQACHRALRDNEDGVKFVASISVSKSEASWNKGMPSDEAFDHYVRYLTSHSVYADAFISKDPEYIKEYGYVLDATQPAILVVAALYATRQAWERKARCEAFLDLYKAGIPLDLAFVFGATASIYDKGKMKMSEAGSSHSHLYTGRLTDKCLVNFINRNYKKGKSYYTCQKEGDDWGSIDNMWGQTESTPARIISELASIKGKGIPGKDALPVDEVVERAADAIDAWRQVNGF